MLRIALFCLVALLSACEPNGLYSVPAGETYLHGIVRVGSRLPEVQEALAQNNIEFSEIAPSDCGEAGNMWMDPRCICGGGPALWLQLSGNARPYNPFYSPTMNAFLAFDDRGILLSTTVLLMGGD